jgi:hypothetical protein
MLLPDRREQHPRPRPRRQATTTTAGRVTTTTAGRAGGSRQADEIRAAHPGMRHWQLRACSRQPRACSRQPRACSRQPARARGGAPGFAARSAVLSCTEKIFFSGKHDVSKDTGQAANRRRPLVLSGRMRGPGHARAGACAGRGMRGPGHARAGAARAGGGRLGAGQDPASCRGGDRTGRRTWRSPAAGPRPAIVRGPGGRHLPDLGL